MLDHAPVATPIPSHLPPTGLTRLALPRLALPRLALPRLALPRLGLPPTGLTAEWTYPPIGLAWPFVRWPLAPPPGAARCLYPPAGPRAEYPLTNRAASPDRWVRRGRAASWLRDRDQETFSGCKR